MRITTRLTLTLTLLALVVLGAFGFYVVRRSRTELEDTVERRTRLIAQALAAGVESDLRAGAWRELQDTLDRLEGDDVVVRVVDVEGVVRGQSRRAAAVDARERASIEVALAGREDFEVVRDVEPMRAFYAVPLVDDRGPLGVLFLGQRLHGLSAAIREMQRDAAVAAVALVLAAAAAAIWIGRVHVTRPIAGLVAAMRRVREGELDPSPPLGTARREPAGELRELRHEFDGMVERLAEAKQELVAAELRRAELERRLQRADKLISIGQLAAGVAHEIGSPLQVLVGRARALETREYAPDAVRRHARIIADQGERIAAIVEHLLHLARRHPERAVATDPVAAALRIVDLLSAEADRRGIALRCESDGTDAVVRCPPGAIEQIVLNLTMNALEATDRDGEVVVALRGDVAGVVELVVRDDGRGVPEEVRPRLFDAFFTTRADEGGTGLGLAVVRELVVELGGEVSIESQVGAGTHVRVRLPRLPRQAREAEEPST
ncbi:MAG: HAMP domain-containing histidine kinase [Deltaproteobacteria bacterium]|nr:HAMP domain-containing histidine kinase [Deltaproteobacteria bacterium]